MDQSRVNTAALMYRTAREKWIVAKELHSSGHHNDAVSRAYYAIFHLLSMVMFLEEKSYSSHGQLIGSFNKELVSTGKLPKEAGKAVGRLFDRRQSADYDFFEKMSEKESADALVDVELVFNSVTNYVGLIHRIDLPNDGLEPAWPKG